MANVVEILINAKNNASKAFKQTATDAGKLQAGVASLKAAFASLAVGVAAREVWDFAMQARQAGNELENARNKLTQAAGGVDEYRATIQAAQAATRGMVSETKLANGAFVLLEMELASNAEEAAKLANAGNILSKAFESQGASVELFNRLLANGSAVLLDNFGISQAQVKARQDEIQATQGLSEQEARLSAIRELAITKAENLASTMSDATVAAGQNQAAYEDMMSALGELILATGDATPVMTGFFNDVTEAAKGWETAVELVGRLKTELAESSDINLDEEIGSINQSLINISNPLGWLLTTLPQLEPALTKLGNNFVQNTEAGKKLGEALVAVYGGSDDVAKGAMGTVTPLSVEAEAALRAAQAYRELAIAQDNAAKRRAIGRDGIQQNDGELQAIRDARKRLFDFEEQQRQENEAAYKKSYDTQVADFNNAATELQNTISSVIQPSLSEVWQPDQDTGNVDEWARRLATVATTGLGSEWTTQLQEQFGGQSFFQPIADAIAAGDNAGAMEAAKEVLTNNVTALYDKELIKQRVREKLQQEQLRDELIKEIQAELGAEGVDVSTGVIATAAGNASLAQEQVKTGLDNVGIAAQDMQTKATGAFDASIKGATDFETVLKRIKTLTGGINGDLSAINQQGVTAGNNFGVLPKSGVGQTQQ